MNGFNDSCLLLQIEENHVVVVILWKHRNFPDETKDQSRRNDWLDGRVPDSAVSGNKFPLLYLCGSRVVPTGKC